MENTTTIINTETTAMTVTETAHEAATIEEGKIRIPGFKVLGFTKVYGTDDILVKVRFENQHLRLKKTVTLSMREVQNAREFRKRIPLSFAIPDVKPSHQIEMLCYAINQALNRSGTTVGEALPQGFSFVGDELFYVMGDCIFPAAAYEKESSVSSDQFIAENPSGAKFFLPTSEARKIKFERALDWVRIYCGQGPAQAVLFLCAMTPYMKHILPEGFSEGNTVPGFVTAPSGYGKTEQIKLLRTTDDMYGWNLECDMKEIWTGLGDFPDRAVQIDDLNKTGSNAVRESKEKKLYSLLQAGNSAAGKVCSKDVNVNLSNTALLISGEYVLHNFSTVNRTILLHVREAFDPETLTWLQQNRAFYGRFLVHFISMICLHREKLKKSLTEYCNHESFQIPNVGEPEEYEGFRRIAYHYKILRLTAHAIELCISNPEKRSELSRMFKDATNICVRDTLEAVRKVKESDVVIAFLELFEQDKLIAKSVEKYFEKKEKLFFLYEDHLYFKGDHLAIHLSRVLNKTVTAKMLSRELGSVNLLSLYGGSYSENLPSKLNRQYPDQGHFYRVNASYLAEMLSERYDPIVYMRFQLHRLMMEQKDIAKEKKKGKKVIINENFGSEIY